MRYVATDASRLAAFRETFGNETVDYLDALEAHYARTDDGSWRADHVSHYASAHPWEDFAESWAQIMHIHDVVSTGAAWRVIAAPDAEFDPTAWVSAAVTTSLAANELARAMGIARPVSVRIVERRPPKDRDLLAARASPHQANPSFPPPRPPPPRPPLTNR